MANNTARPQAGLPTAYVVVVVIIVVVHKFNSEILSGGLVLIEANVVAILTYQACQRRHELTIGIKPFEALLCLDGTTFPVWHGCCRTLPVHCS